MVERSLFNLLFLVGWVPPSIPTLLPLLITDTKIGSHKSVNLFLKLHLIRYVVYKYANE